MSRGWPALLAVLAPGQFFQSFNGIAQAVETWIGETARKSFVELSPLQFGGGLLA